MGLDSDFDSNETHLSEEERMGLLLPFISTQTLLNEQEQVNIESALKWIHSKRRVNPSQLLSEAFIRQLHKKMYGEIWSWAGQFRKSDKNRGIVWHQIPIELKKLMDDTSYLISNEVYTPEEIAIRFKHRLVVIHCFPNGNGRHSRLMADIMMEKLFKQNLFSWGSKNLTSKNEIRSIYIKSLQHADNGNMIPIIEFAQS